MKRKVNLYQDTSTKTRNSKHETLNSAPLRLPPNPLKGEPVIAQPRNSKPNSKHETQNSSQFP